jgi:hypothetical protein
MSFGPQNRICGKCKEARGYRKALEKEHNRYYFWVPEKQRR